MAEETPTTDKKRVRLANFDTEEWRAAWKRAPIGERQQFLRTLAGLLREVRACPEASDWLDAYADPPGKWSPKK